MDGLEASPLTRRPTVATPITKRTLLTLGAATVAVALGTSAQAGDCPAVVPGDPSDIGSWELLPYVSEVMVVHAAVMHTGKVLLFSGELEAGLPHLSGVWDPATGDFLDLFLQVTRHLADVYDHDDVALGGQLPGGGNPAERINAGRINHLDLAELAHELPDHVPRQAHVPGGLQNDADSRAALER